MADIIKQEYKYRVVKCPEGFAKQIRDMPTIHTGHTVQEMIERRIAEQKGK